MNPLKRKKIIKLRRKRLREALSLQKKEKAVEIVVEKEEAPLVVDEPVVKEEALKKAAPKKAAPKKASKKKAN